MILLLDDFHNIHTIRKPDTTTTSQAIDMASCLVDMQRSLQAIKLPPREEKVHREVLVDCGKEVKICRGGISTETVVKIFEEFMLEYHHTYLESLPEKYKEFDSTAAEACLKELRVYTGGADKSDLDSMASVLLLDEIESKMRSTSDFKKILDHLTSQHPTITKYLDKYAMLTPGDWRVWYNLKKIMCTHAEELPSSYLSIIPLLAEAFSLVKNGKITMWVDPHKDVQKCSLGKKRKSNPSARDDNDNGDGEEEDSYESCVSRLRG
ncbi:hypothetical protein OS493_000680 [Desmophyllum pertusum]|uniref:Uncharacterized protein n=1 Tax=Desmophyllum pertusum TaxID=174260 RepID=A0A9X0DCF5_9CNID|nr:hypothetical protein OS493_000680 [Desmophyllum pertusum]